METLRKNTEQPPLVAWGKRFNEYKNTLAGPDYSVNGQIHVGTLPVVEDPICPRCRKFSYFCMVDGDFNKPAALLWRQSPIGFVPEPASSADHFAGTLTILCPKCEALFGFRIKMDMIDAYRADCVLWPKESVEPASSSPEFKRMVQVIRRMAPFKHDHLDDVTFLAEFERFEALSAQK